MYDARRQARNIFDATACFDPTQDQPEDLRKREGYSDTAAVVFDFMLADQDDWIYPRPIIQEITDRLDRGVRVVLSGEKGCGKTTALRSLPRSRNTSELSARALFLACDFNYETGDALFTKRSAALGDVASYFADLLDEALANSDALPAVSQRTALNLVRRSSYFTELKAALAQRDQHVHLINPLRLQDLISADAELDRLWKSATHRYYQQTPRARQVVQTFKAAIEEGFAFTIAFDNIDQLKPASRKAVAQMALALASAGRQRVGIVVACRSVNTAEMRVELDPGKTWELSAMPVPSEMTWDLIEIMEKRIDVASSGRLFIKLVEAGLVTDSSRLTDELGGVRATYLNTLRALWNKRVANTDERDELARGLVSWHNGNLRDVCQSVADLSYQPVDPRYLGLDSNTSVRRARNIVYRHILSSRLPSDGTRFIELHPSLRLFEARSEQSEGHLPFHFLMYRVLAHLTFRHSPQKVAKTCEVFRHYGVEPERVCDVLDQLAVRTGFDSGFVRFASERGVEASSAARDGVRVELLPAGAYLVDELVASCEYMFWSAATIADCQQRLARRVGTSVSNLRKGFPSDEHKVTGATIFLRHYLMPRFLEEHPYMDPSSNKAWGEDAKTRLRHFREDFGYSKHSWFIRRLRLSIRAYAGKLDEPLPAPDDEDLLYVEHCEKKLNRITESIASAP